MRTLIVLLCTLLCGCFAESASLNPENRCSVGVFKGEQKTSNELWCLYDYPGHRIDCFSTREKMEAACETVRESERCE